VQRHALDAEANDPLSKLRGALAPVHAVAYRCPS
jgi:hypothetical protein